MMFVIGFSPEAGETEHAEQEEFLRMLFDEDKTKREDMKMTTKNLVYSESDWYNGEAISEPSDADIKEYELEQERERECDHCCDVCEIDCEEYRIAKAFN